MTKKKKAEIKIGTYQYLPGPRCDKKVHVHNDVSSTLAAMET